MSDLMDVTIVTLRERNESLLGRLESAHATIVDLRKHAQRFATYQVELEARLEVAAAEITRQRKAVDRACDHLVKKDDEICAQSEEVERLKAEVSAREAGQLKAAKFYEAQLTQQQAQIKELNAVLATWEQMGEGGVRVE